jgi:ATP-dependent helicase HrpA
MIETSRLFARICANIDHRWLEKLGGDLCKYTYVDPHWERNRGEVVAYEQVSLFGLIIVSRRPVSYGGIDADEAATIFIQKALVQGDVKTPFDFMKHNQSLIDDAAGLENKIRRKDILVSESELFDFYRHRLKGCYDIKTLSKIIKQKGNDRFLRMKANDVVRYYPDKKEISLYPDSIAIGDRRFDCSYRFEPGKKEDGVTVTIPSPYASTVSEAWMDWMVPGLFKEKISALIKGLPKRFRKQLVPVANTVEIIADEMPKTQNALVTALGEFIYRRFGVDIPAAAWPDDTLPDYLKMRISITDSKGNEICAGRDTRMLHADVPGSSRTDPGAEIASAKKKWEATGITRWNFPDLPESISIDDRDKTKWLLYPALKANDPRQNSVDLLLFQNRQHAVSSHKQGVCVLFTRYFSKDLKFLKRVLTVPKDMEKLCKYFGGVKRFESMMVERVIGDLFAKNIRTKDAFYAHAESVKSSILPTGQNVLSQCLSILQTYGETRAILFELEKTNAGNSMAKQFLEGLRNDLAKLVPETFVHLYHSDRRACLDRYIKAVAIRAQRALVHFEKDQAKAGELQFFTDSLQQLVETLTDGATEEKRTAVEEYFWLIEEYKVSLFAQELKTAVPVSKKRLTDKLKKIERMR